MRTIGSSHADPLALAGRGASHGPLHGGATGRAQDAARDRIDQQHPGVHQARQGGRRPPHDSATASTKFYDPRAKIIKRMADWCST
jgi:citrate synthase